MLGYSADGSILPWHSVSHPTLPLPPPGKCQTHVATDLPSSEELVPVLGVQLHPSGRLLRLRWGGGALAPLANLDDVLVALQEQRAERDLPWPSKVSPCSRVAPPGHRTGGIVVRYRGTDDFNRACFCWASKRAAGEPSPAVS